MGKLLIIDSKLFYSFMTLAFDKQAVTAVFHDLKSEGFDIIILCEKRLSVADDDKYEEICKLAAPFDFAKTRQSTETAKGSILKMPENMECPEFEVGEEKVAKYSTGYYFNTEGMEQNIDVLYGKSEEKKLSIKSKQYLCAASDLNVLLKDLKTLASGKTLEEIESQESHHADPNDSSSILNQPSAEKKESKDGNEEVVELNDLMRWVEGERSKPVPKLEGESPSVKSVNNALKLLHKEIISEINNLSPAAKVSSTDKPQKKSIERLQKLKYFSEAVKEIFIKVAALNVLVKRRKPETSLKFFIENAEETIKKDIANLDSELLSFNQKIARAFTAFATAVALFLSTFMLVTVVAPTIPVVVPAVVAFTTAVGGYALGDCLFKKGLFRLDKVKREVRNVNETFTDYLKSIPVC